MKHGVQAAGSQPVQCSLPLASAWHTHQAQAAVFIGALQHLASLTLQPVTVPTTGLAPVGQAPNLVGRGQGVCRSEVPALEITSHSGDTSRWIRASGLHSWRGSPRLSRKKSPRFRACGAGLADLKKFCRGRAS